VCRAVGNNLYQLANDSQSKIDRWYKQGTIKLLWIIEGSAKTKEE